MIFSMGLRFVPLFKTQALKISNAQKCIGRDVSNGTFLERIRHGMKILSILVTWALENAIETADSMKSRGYGFHGRTSFSIFRFDARDKGIFLFMLALIGILCAGAFRGQIDIQYFPSVKMGEITGFGILVYATYFLFCFAPIILNIMEELKWQHLQSKI